ncbi:hypothetical protein CHARACLAT_027951 [Characodon lateralis]|uniref:Uncharacterized protein n=1 Tax=Characodon lateralis TaxID=208331 RepID=A0ABU7EXC7_9TELE|nr:hypothetical protein [Characodon lateralis]
MRALIPPRFLENWRSYPTKQRRTWTTYQLAIRLSPAEPNLSALRQSSSLQPPKPWWPRTQLSVGLDSPLSPWWIRTQLVSRPEQQLSFSTPVC